MQATQELTDDLSTGWYDNVRELENQSNVAVMMDLPGNIDAALPPPTPVGKHRRSPSNDSAGADSGFDSGGSSGKGRAAAAARQPPKGTRFGKGKGKAAKQREQSNLLRRTRTEPVRQSGGHISVSGSSRSIELGIPVGRRMWTDARAWGDHFGSDLPDWYVGKLKKTVCERWVSSGDTGDFIVRDSSKKLQCVLCVNDRGKALNFRIVVTEGGKFVLGSSGKEMERMTDLIDMLKKQPFSGSKGGTFSLVGVAPLQLLEQALMIASMKRRPGKPQAAQQASPPRRRAHDASGGGGGGGGGGGDTKSKLPSISQSQQGGGTSSDGKVQKKKLLRRSATDHDESFTQRRRGRTSSTGSIDEGAAKLKGGKRIPPSW